MAQNILVVENSCYLLKDGSKLIGKLLSVVLMLELTDALGDAIDGLESELKKHWWWRIFWPVLLYSPLILIGIYLYKM